MILYTLILHKVKEKGESLKDKVLSLGFTAMLVLSTLAIFAVNPVRAQSGSFYMVPDNNIFFTNTTSVGATFKVTIMCSNVVQLFDWQVGLSFDGSLLSVAEEDIVIPADNILKANFPGNTYEPSPSVEAGYVGFSQSITGDPKVMNFTGSGKLAEVTFHIIKAPERKQTVSTVIHFVVPGDPQPLKTLWEDAATVSYTPSTDDGYYEFSWAPPTQLPWLQVSPATVTMGLGGAQVTGKHFTIDILVKNVVADWMMIGAQARLYYNKTLVTYVSATEGTFFSTFATHGTWFNVEKDDGTLNIGIIMLPNGTGYYDFTTWPSGEGKLCTIEFEVATQLEFPWEATDKFDLEPLFGICFIDVDDAPIPHADPVDGTYHIYGYVLGLQIDVYTQYPEPYGGQGANMPSDMFGPQAEVVLYAKVLYNLDPVQAKLVSFEIRHGEFVIRGSNFTNSEGIAEYRFRIPWPCENAPERVFGIWNVTANVEVAEQIVTDTLAFKVYWLVEIVSVTPKQTEYIKYKDQPPTLEFEVVYRTYRIQPIPVVITVAGYDELNFFIGSDNFNTTVGWGTMDGWCQFKEYTTTLSFPMPSNAVVGTATVRANAFDKLPWVGGVPYCPEKSEIFRILRP